MCNLPGPFDMTGTSGKRYIFESYKVSEPFDEHGYGAVFVFLKAQDIDYRNYVYSINYIGETSDLKLTVDKIKADNIYFIYDTTHICVLPIDDHNTRQQIVQDLASHRILYNDLLHT